MARKSHGRQHVYSQRKRCRRSPPPPNSAAAVQIPSKPAIQPNQTASNPCAVSPLRRLPVSLSLGRAETEWHRVPISSLLVPIFHSMQLTYSKPLAPMNPQNVTPHQPLPWCQKSAILHPWPALLTQLFPAFGFRLSDLIRPSGDSAFGFQTQYRYSFSDPNDTARYSY